MTSRNLLVIIVVLGSLPVAPAVYGQIDAPPWDLGVRAFLGVRSIPVYFAPDKKMQACYLGIIKFNKGKEAGISGEADGFIERKKMVSFSKPELGFTTEAYHPELLWGKKDGRDGYAIVANEWNTYFIEDPFFKDLGCAHFMANGKTPKQTYQDYTVLGYVMGGISPPPTTNFDDPHEVIAKAEKCILFVVKFFPTRAEAEDFQAKVTASKKP